MTMTTPSKCTACGLPLFHGKCPHCSTGSQPADYLRELEKLRVSLVRIAQKLGVDHVPGCKLTDSYTEFAEAAFMQPRGWNSLAAHITDAIDEEQKKVRAETRRRKQFEDNNRLLAKRNRELALQRDRALEELDDIDYELEKHGYCYHPRT